MSFSKPLFQMLNSALGNQMYRQTHRQAHRRLQLAVCLLIAAAIGLTTSLIGFQSRRSSNKPVPVLQGEAALAQLKQDGQFDSLQAAMQTARLSVSRVEKTPLGRAAWHAPNRAAGYDAYVTEDGVSLALKESAPLSLHLHSLGYGDAMQAVSAGEVSGDKQSITIERDNLREWFINGAAGLEHGFTLATPPQSALRNPQSALRLALQVGDGWRATASADGSHVSLRNANGQAVDYGKLVVRDAEGRDIPGKLTVANQQVVIEVTDHEAAYPLTIDPLFTLEKRLLANDGQANDNFGYAVALDGNTAVIGAPAAGVTESAQGAVYVFTRSGSGWTFQQKLLAPVADANVAFGAAVALSGNTLVAGEPESGNGTGAAYVFTRGGTTWTFQQKLIANDAAQQDHFGAAVALDGDTAIIGAPQGDTGSALNQGTAYIFTRGGVNWTQQQELAANDAAPGDQFGFSVALDGDTALIGAPGDDGIRTDQGSAYIFTRSGANWTQQPRLSDELSPPAINFGNAVALSGDKAAIGASAYSSGVVITFRRAATGWTRSGVISNPVLTGAHFGASLALSGDTLVVGASLGPSDTGADQRSAYVYSLSGQPTLKRQFVPDVGAANDGFGYAVALDGDTVLIGAYKADAAANDQGAAFVYGLRDQFAEQSPKLTAFDGLLADHFGNAIALSGDTLAIGASYADIGTAVDRGAVYVFVRNGASTNVGWTFQKKIIAPDDGSSVGFARFGTSVALSGNTLAVGMPEATINGNFAQGAVYVFIRSGTNWVQQDKLNASAIDGLPGDRFGYSVALEGDTLVLGAPGQSSQRGAIYVFTRNGVTWAAQGPKLLANDGAAGDRLGQSIALSGDTLVAGANQAKIGANLNQGAAYVFTRTGTTWAQQTKFTAADGAANDEFGISVAISGDTAAAGAWRHKVGANDSQGAAYVFSRNGATWTPFPALTANDGGVGDKFGCAVALGGDTLVVGAYGYLVAQGAAYVFTRAGAWLFQQKLSPSNQSGLKEFGRAVVISGDTVIVGAPQENITNGAEGAAYVYAAPRCPAITLTPASLPNGAVGVAYNQPFTVSGSGGVTLSVSSGALPPGLMLDDGLVGTPTVAGTYRFTITATDTNTLCPSSRAYTLTIAPPCPTLTVTPPVVPNGTVGAPYSQTYSASGGAAPYSFILRHDASPSPPGLSLSTNGVLSGTPTAVGAFTFDVVVTDANGCTGTRNYTLNIACPATTLNPATLPNGATGTAYSQTLTASGGAGVYTFSVTAGALPPGLSLNANGTLGGTPTQVGQYNFTITASANGCTGTRQYTLTITQTCAAITITPTTLPIAPVGQSYSQTLTASGGTGPYQFALVGGTLPAGLSLAANGTLSGTPTVANTSVFTVQATDANGCADTSLLSLRVNAPPEISAVDLTVRQGDPAALLQVASVSELGESVAGVTVTVNGGTSATVNGVTLSGLTLNSSGVVRANVAVTCTASNAGFTLAATDSAGATATATLNVTVTANPVPTLSYANQSVTAGGALQINPATGPSDNGSVTLIGVQSVGAFTGTLSVNNATGVISVSNAQPAGAHTITIRATDNCGATRDAVFTLSVGCPTITIAPANLPNATKGVSYQQTLTANGGAAPYNFAVTAGALPQGLNLNASGALTGTPTQSGSFNFTVTATDANGCTKAQGYGLSVNAPPTVTALNLTARQSDPAATVSIANADDADQAPQTLNVSVNGGASANVNGVTVNGLTINATGVISAQVAATCTATNANFTLTVTDNAGASATTTLNVTVTANPAPTLSYANQSVTAGGALQINPATGPSDNSSIATIAVLSAGTFTGTISVNNTTGVVSVSNAQPAGSHTITIRATDNCGATRDASFTLGVGCPAITITPATLPAGTVGTTYNQTLTANGGTAPYSFSISVGALPTGLNLSAAGQLTGTPTASGTATFTVKATDANGCAGISEFTLTVNALCPTITVNPSNAALPAGQAGTQYNQTFTQTGGAGAAMFAVTVGALPNGLALSTAGVLSGTPTAFGDFNFTVTATDTNGCIGARAYSLHINAPCPTITVNPTSLPNGTVGTAYNQTATATGGAAPYAYSISAGALPGGVTLASGGGLTGTPNTPGVFNFTIKATDANGCMGTRAYAVTINPAVVNPGLQFYPLPKPLRLLDTRAGQLGCDAPGAQIQGNT
ncbi:MAG TPA: putative Ig domain-containing protein, partial [Blastocatellia bacterium]|nr:putative Ig domain-containing protein [Blastocatellia bacterium]